RRKLYLSPPVFLQDRRNLDVAQKLEMLDRVEPLRAPRMPQHERQLAIRRAVPAPLEIVLGLQGLVFVINTEEATVQIEPRVVKVVVIAAKERDLLLRREDQPHIGVAPVTVEVIAAALIKRDDLAEQPRFFLRF